MFPLSLENKDSHNTPRKVCFARWWFQILYEFLHGVHKPAFVVEHVMWTQSSDLSSTTLIHKHWPIRCLNRTPHVYWILPVIKLLSVWHLHNNNYCYKDDTTPSTNQLCFHKGGEYFIFLSKNTISLQRPKQLCAQLCKEILRPANDRFEITNCSNTFSDRFLTTKSSHLQKTNCKQDAPARISVIMIRLPTPCLHSATAQEF